jgi:tRNA-dihydrouridine synthase 2
MREKDRAVIERLREIVDFVEGLGRGIAVVENGDCKDWEDARHVREITGAHSVMIARGAESNPSCFASQPLKDVDNTLLPVYLRVVRELYVPVKLFLIISLFQSQYLQNHFSLTKFCVNQFKGTRVAVSKAESLAFRQTLSQAKDYSNLMEIMGPSSGEEDFQQIVKAIKEHPPKNRRMLIDRHTQDYGEVVVLVTPKGTQNPEPPGSGAPFLPNDMGRVLVKIPGHDATTPSPSGRVTHAPI